MPKTRIILAITLAILAVSTSSIFIRAAQKESPSIAIAAMRLTLAAVAIAPLAIAKYPKQLTKRTSKEWQLALLAGIFLAAHFATWITSLEYTTVISSVVLVTTGPLWVAILSPIFIKEMPTRWVWVGMTLALIGGIIIGLGDFCTPTRLTLSCPPLSTFTTDSAFLGNLLALAGAWAFAGYLLIGRNLRIKMDLIPYIFIVYSVAAVSLLLLAIISKQGFTGYSTITYLYIIGLALIPQLIGHSTFNWALKYMPASLVSITTLGEPIGSAMLALILLKETPSPLTLAGGTFILIGIYLSSKNP